MNIPFFISVLLANQLVLKHHCRLVVLDADPQRSIVKKHEQDRERWPQLQPLYQVVPCTQLSSEKETLNLIRAMRNEDFDFIIDTPGSLTQQGLLPLMFEADAIVTPFQMEKTSVNGTTAFMDMGIMVAKENGLDRLPPFYFLPNQFTSPSLAPSCRKCPTAPRSSATARSSSPTSSMR